MSIDKKMAQTEKDTLKLESDLEKEIKLVYQTALDDLRKMLFVIDSKYGDKDGVVSYAEIQKYNRMESIEKEQTEIMNKVSNETQSKTIAYGVDAWLLNYYRTGYTLETELQEKLGFKVINKSDVDVVNPDMKLSMKNNKTFEQTKVNNVIQRGIAQGKSTKQVANDLKVQLGKSATNAMTTARTTTTRVQNEAIVKAGNKAIDKGIDLVKKWNATLDGSTRDTHGALDQVKKEKGENFSSGGYSAPAPGQFGAPAMDYNCRCRLTYVPRDFTEAEYRRAKGTDSKGILIPYTNYNDWYKNRVSAK